MKKGWSELTFTDFATLVRREASIDDDGEYPEVGVRCFGKGLFHKLARTGIEVGDKKLFRLKEGDFILQVTFAWEGAVAIVGKEDESLFGSVRVLTFEIDAAVCDTRFLRWYFRTAAGVAQLARISPGTAGRNKVLAIGRLGEMKIPLPPLLEQQRIVAHLDAIEARLTRAQKLREEQERELKAALSSAFHKLEVDVTWKPVAEVAPLAWRQITIDPDESYTEFGLRSFYKGIFLRRKVAGSTFSWQELYRLKAGDIVFSNIMAWEKAIAIAHPEHDGWVGNHRMLVCEPRPDVVLPSYLLHYFMTSEGFAKILQASPGTAARNKTLKADNLMAIEVPIPSLSRQRTFESLCDHVARIRAAQKPQIADATTVLPSLLNRIFNS